ncbi:hypothetical protein PVAP13_5NG583601 [Panicum virgatum]|uniref:Uncharacterized protein n=1 Tax=Panicum virgatum TaxID=38727 RepID=A0A8T0S4B7_PANVG|nr:hypothetical protein PVAP13_5NG583601 [Panicum virgatum]
MEWNPSRRRPPAACLAVLLHPFSQAVCNWWLTVLLFVEDGSVPSQKNLLHDGSSLSETCGWPDVIQTAQSV